MACLNFLRLLLNLLWVYVAYFACRIAFLLENSSIYDGETLDYGSLFGGGLLFDTSAIFYYNSLFILLFISAGYFSGIGRWAKTALRILYTAVNSSCILLNLVDSVFFTTRLQRSTAAVFREFYNDTNIHLLIGGEILSHWYLVLVAIVIAWFLWKAFFDPVAFGRKSWDRYLAYSVCFVVVGFLSVCGMRGSIPFLQSTRPISVNYAFSFTSEPKQTGIVLNTPFSLIRTLGNTVPATPDWFSSEQLDAVYSPVHLPSSARQKRKNVVILILESFSGEFVGGMNREFDGGSYQGYTPFLDELMDSCLWFDRMIANTCFSIDAPPAILASIPRADHPFVVSTHSLNHINSLATELKSWGYDCSFFHGAENGSLGINAFTRQAGFDNYYGKNEFLADERFGGMAEYDGKWGIWDEPFLGFFCTKLSETPQPFLASLFTLSSHHPFSLPEKYKDVFTDEGIFPIHKVVRYTDFALRKFFEEARTQPWFNNTVFVISADHTSSCRTHDEYKTDIGDFIIPILIYDPSGGLPCGKQPGIIQQIDIMPTILSYLGYDKPYVAFGKDVLSMDADDMWAFNWNKLQTLIKGDYMLVFDNGEPLRFYNYVIDPHHQDDLLGKGMPEEEEMLRLGKAIIQSYLGRMNGDNVTAR